MKTNQIFFLTLFLLTCTFFLDGMVIYMCLSGKVQGTDGAMLAFIGTLIGGINIMAGNSCNWWFGSNKGSSEKDATISDMAVKGTGNGTSTGTSTTTQVTPEKTTVTTTETKPTDPLPKPETPIQPPV